jgi:hypothetical protein
LTIFLCKRYREYEISLRVLRFPIGNGTFESIHFLSGLAGIFIAIFPSSNNGFR